MTQDTVPLPSLRIPDRVRLPLYLAILILPAVFLALVIHQPWFDARWMFMDVLTAARESTDCCHATFGLVSQAGILMWGGTSAIALFAALVLHARPAPVFLRNYMLFAGLLTGWLVLDDTYLLHESILPGLGLSQTAIQGLYGVLAVIYLALNRASIRSGEWPLLLGAGLLLAASVGFDEIVEARSFIAVVLEDALKFYGYALWSGFHVATAAILVLSQHQADEDTPGT